MGRVDTATDRRWHCQWPSEICSDYAFWMSPVPLCRRHGAEVNGKAEQAKYRAFLQAKTRIPETDGIESVSLSTRLYDFQADVTRWALRRGRAAVFADCGLGKTFIQLEWARAIKGRVLILAPLCVSGQTVELGCALGVEVHPVRDATELKPGINIANYEMLRHFIDAPLDGIVLDESSILKSLDGKTKTLLLERFNQIPMRLCCTATPCPNDIAELANHAEFLGVMRRVEMLATFFVHDDEGWRLRGHAREPFYRWMASWAMAFKSPADLGYDGSRFNLPPLNIEEVVVKTEWRREGELFAGGLRGIGDRAAVRKETAPARVEQAVRLCGSTDGQVVVWCGLDAESHAAAKAITGAMEVHGSDDPEDKTRKIQDFTEGRIRVLVIKPKIGGFGLNLQNAAHMVFLGLGDSFESYYQCIRRCWRYGQKRPVTAWIVVSDHERAIVDNVRRKESESSALTTGIVEALRKYEVEELKHVEYQEQFNGEQVSRGQDWELHHGDCVEAMRRLMPESIDLSIFSPPFSSLYVYSASERDLGNSANVDEFFEHFGFVIKGLMRLTKLGRLCVVHIAQQPLTQVNDGIIGLRDLRGRAVEEFVNRGWVYHGECVIDKDPQAQAIRTHSKGLLFVQLKRDASWLRPALADYLLVFRKPGENAAPIKPDLTNDEWIEWARPIWYGIRESDTLNAAEARERDDERHICPLQLGTIERAIRLWSNPGETVFSPFAGIGSEGYQALLLNRRFVGAELKPRYCEVAIKNLNTALSQRKQQELFAAKG